MLSRETIFLKSLSLKL